MVSTCPQGTFKFFFNNLNCSNAAVKAVNILLKAVMTYQARAASSPFVCPIVSEPDTIEWGEGEEGDLDSFLPDLGSSGRGKKRAKASCWGVQLSHLHTCGFSLKPEKNFTARLHELTPRLLFTALVPHKSGPPQ